jgi:hypothetical protein
VASLMDSLACLPQRSRNPPRIRIQAEDMWETPQSNR